MAPARWRTCAPAGYKANVPRPTRAAALLPSLEAVVLGVFFMLALRPPPDADTFLHLATGRLVLAGTIPAADPFSHTIAGQSWIAHEWLAAAVLEALHRLGGLALVVWAGAFACLAALIAVRRLLDLEEVTSPLARVAALLIAGICIRNVVLPRPHVITLVFLAAELVLLARVRRGASLASLCALPPLFVAWGNAHGGFILGGLPLGVAGLDALADARAGDPRARRRFLALFACGLASIAALCLNPHGPALLAFPFGFDARAPHLALVDEWKPPDYRGENRLHALVLIALVAVPLLWPARARAGEVAGIALTVHLALSAVRNQFLLALFAAPALARCLERGVREGPLAPLDARLAATARRAGTALPLALLAAAALALAVRADWQPRATMPVDAASYLTDRGLTPRLFNDYAFGGYLLWRGQRVFIDGRIEIYHQHGVLPDYLAIAELRPGWDRLMERYRIDAAVLPPASPLAAALASRGWRRAFTSPPAVVLLDSSRFPEK